MSVSTEDRLMEFAENSSYPNYTYNFSDSVICDMDYSSPYFQAVIYVMYSIIFLVSIVGNGMICYVVVNSARMRTVTNYFIMNLAIGDILITIFCVPFTSISYLQQYWTFGSFLCPIVNYSQAVSVFVSAYTLLVISVDRYMAIMWPLKRRITKKIAGIIVVVLWILAGMTALPIPIFSRLSQPNNTWYIYCDKYLCLEDWSGVGEQYEKLYTIVLMMMQYVIPLSVLVFTYTSIGIVIWCHRIPGEAENSRDQRIARSKKKVITQTHDEDHIESAPLNPDYESQTPNSNEPNNLQEDQSPETIIATPSTSKGKTTTNNTKRVCSFTQQSLPNRKRKVANSIEQAMAKLQNISDQCKKPEDDEFDLFCKRLACQLKKMPLERALVCVANCNR